MQQGSSAASAAGAPRRRLPLRNGAASPSSSVWEKRMKMDQVKGGIMVFDGEGSRDSDEDGLRVYRRLRRNQSEAAAEKRKRRSWRTTGEPVTIADARLRRARSAAAAGPEPLPEKSSDGKNADADDDEEEGDDGGDDAGDEAVEVGVDHCNEKNKKDVEEVVEEICPDKTELKEVVEEICPDNKDEEAVHVSEDVKELEEETVCFLQGDEEEVQRMENKAIDPESVNQPQEEKEMVQCKDDQKALEQEQSNDAHPDGRLLKPEMVRLSPEKKLQQPLKPTIPERRASLVSNQRAVSFSIPKPSPEGRAAPAAATAPISRQQVQQPPATPPPEYHEELNQSTRANHGKMQSIVDLIMWRDVSKSALVFGLGAFLLVSSSYAKDLNFNPISAASYMALVYLGLIFIYKSILYRGAMVECEETDERYVVREEDAIWLLNLVLPYVNELLLKIRSLFTGDPATTMKLALLLFAMARCGSFVTLWTLAKLVFFGVFIIPKVFSSYSNQLARYGRFWLERFRDAWDSCTHKKAAAAALFTLIWNISSTTARIWAVFMLVVAIKYFYQQKLVEGWNEPEEGEETQQEPIREVSRQSQAQMGLRTQSRHRRMPPSPEQVIEKTKIRGGIQRRL